MPVISVDTKKKELVGVFKNAGAKWDREPVLVNDHDFRSDADGIADPYGVYDLQANRGTVFVGGSYDTPAFAVDCIEKWWRTATHAIAWATARAARSSSRTTSRAATGPPAVGRPRR